MTDVVLFCGPVILRPELARVPWRRPTVVRAISIAGSSANAEYARSMRGSDGRILPSLLRRHAPDVTDPGLVCMAAWSAGWGLLNEVFQVPDDLERTSATVLCDAAFGSHLVGIERMAARALRGDKLMVITESNNPANYAAGIMKTARETVVEVLGNAEKAAGVLLRDGRPSPPMPTPSGGVHTAGELFWYDTVKPGSPPGQGNDFTHAEHHELLPAALAAYVVPWFANGGARPMWPWLVGAGAVSAAAVLAAWRWSR